MITAKINGIFPTPIYQTNIDRDFTKNELSIVEKYKKNYKRNYGNTTSEDSYILNNKVFKNINKELNIIILDYFDKIINPINKIQPYITQSWLNYTKTNEHHHIHRHPNSLVSGVLYINADEKNDKINFFKEEKETIKLDPKEANHFNSESWWFPVRTGDILLFPSNLQHAVETKQGDNLRISLAFNVFIKGTIGIKDKLTELKLV
jgi:uncharacterized protein (TIGR02466 family)